MLHLGYYRGSLTREQPSIGDESALSTRFTSFITLHGIGDYTAQERRGNARALFGSNSLLVSFIEWITIRSPELRADRVGGEPILLR